jgi:ABC-type Na+ transport system ATPase subunit NatA
MVVLHQGRLCFSGAPRALMQRYAEDSMEQAFLKCIEGNADG